MDYGDPDWDGQARWIGFMEGALASGRVEEDEMAALVVEARRLSRSSEIEETHVLASELRNRGLHSEADVISCLKDVSDERRQEPVELGDLDRQGVAEEFLGLCVGIAADGVILKSEAEAVVRRGEILREMRMLQAWPELVAVLDAVRDSLTDGRITPGEGHGIATLIADVDEALRDPGTQ